MVPFTGLPGGEIHRVSLTLVSVRARCVPGASAVCSRCDRCARCAPGVLGVLGVLGALGVLGWHPVCSRCARPSARRCARCALGFDCAFSRDVLMFVLAFRGF